MALLRRSTGDDFRFAAAVAEMGMLLRGSEHAGGASWEQVLELAEGALKADEWNARVDPMIEALQQELSDLQVEAGRAGVPLEHRRGPCR